MRSPRNLLLALAAAPLVLLSACSPDDTADDTTDAATQSGVDADSSTGDAAGGTAGDDAAATSGAAAGGDDAAATSGPVVESDITELAVEKKDDKPVITWDGKDFPEGDLPFAVSATTTEQVKAGKGDAVADGDDVQVKYLAVNGTSGEQLLSTFDADETVTMALANERLIPAFAAELPGRKPGEAFLMAVPPAEGFGTSGNPNLGLAPEDTLVFYVEVVSTGEPLTQAEGKAVKPKKGLPTVEADGASPAKIDVEGVDAPEKLVAQQLIKGEGPKVKAGQTIRVHYTGVALEDGKQFDSSYTGGQPIDFPIGVGQVITGWDEGLVGQPVGSRVLLVIPAEDAYGTDPEGHELGGKDLVFVVDILGAY